MFTIRLPRKRGRRTHADPEVVIVGSAGGTMVKEMENRNA